MFGKIIQKWNAFKIDWKEYQRLRRVAARAWRKLESVRGKITVFYSADGAEKIKRCISRKLVVMPKTVLDEDWNPNRCDLMPFDSYCSHFKADITGEKVSPCSETNCPCYAGNCEYVAAAKELALARENRRTFWNRPKAR